MIFASATGEGKAGDEMNLGMFFPCIKSLPSFRFEGARGTNRGDDEM
jgi:hypothetical protein